MVGWYGRGDEQPDSDVDLIVLVQRTDRAPERPRVDQ